jgi:hypothetical protein
VIAAPFLRAVLVVAAPSAWWCAMSLAGTCGERTLDASATTPRRVLARLEFPVANDAKPTGLVTADLDGDGRDEIVAVTTGPGTIQIWGGVSNELRAAPAPRVFAIDDFALGPVWLGGARPATKESPALAVFASRTNPGVSVVDLRAAWKAAPNAPLPIAWHVDLARRPRVIASGDLGGDGKPEVAVITVDDDLLLVRGPSDVAKMHLGDEQATCALFGADKKSIYVGFQGSRRVVRYEVEGPKLVEKSAAELEGLPRAIDELVAFDGVGGATNILVAGGDDKVWTFSSNLGAPMRTGVSSGSIPIAAFHGPLLADGKLAFVTIALNGQQAITSGIGASGPAEISRVYAGQHPLAGALGDFDGDTKLDLVIANGDAKRISVLFGDGKGGFDIATNAKAGRSPHSLAIGDLDGDKKPDVVVLNALEGTISVLANRGGKLADHEVQGQAPNADAVRLVDLDGDGFLDAAFLQRTDKGSALTAYFGDGKGHLWQRAEVMPIDVSASSGDLSGDLRIVDLDGDGSLEAIVADPEGGKVALVPIEKLPGGSAHGPGVAFGKARAIDVPTSPRALALLDAQGDAHLEIAVALGSPGKRLGVAILRTKKDAIGALVLEECGFIPLDEGALAIAAADFDGNGFTDLAVLVEKSESDRAFRVLYQASDRTWSVSERTSTSLRAYALRAGDIDGDGRPDILVSAQNSHHLNLWLNGGGNPVSWARTADLGAGTGPLDVQLVDLDGDGKLEIVVANAFSNDVSVIRFR